MDADELLAIEDNYDFATDLYYFLVDDEPELTALQEKFSTCYWGISQHDNGGLTGMLYNADDRESWCRKVEGYCRELGAENSAKMFDDIAPIFSLPETEGSTWGQ
ncbi:MAG: hypothetical protein ACI8T1_000178 [Verrucomicrobiales bacterium]|jgi:hypothetical protein